MVAQAHRHTTEASQDIWRTIMHRNFAGGENLVHRYFVLWRDYPNVHQVRVSRFKPWHGIGTHEVEPELLPTGIERAAPGVSFP